MGGQINGKFQTDLLKGALELGWYPWYFDLRCAGWYHYINGDGAGTAGMMTCFPSQLLNGHLFAGFSKPSFPVLVIQNGFIEILFAEVGPAHIGEIQFCIGQLV